MAVTISTPSGWNLPVLELRNVTKRYAFTEVLSDVSLSLRHGEIHVLVGENGAGKSTLLRVAAGFVKPDRGSIWVAGEEMSAGNPRTALKTGVAYVSQELTAVPARTVLENVFLGTGRLRFGHLRRPEVLSEFHQLCDRIQSNLSADVFVRSLSQAQRQELEILRALARRPRILILDEPTAALDGDRSERILRILKQLASEDIAIIFVSHRLNEVFSIADRISVLRDGHMVASENASEVTEASLVHHMVGRDVSYLFPQLPEVATDAPVVFSTADLSAGPHVQDITLSVKRGEIVGLAGLIGAGRSEFAMAAIGAAAIDHGHVAVGDSVPFRPHSVGQMARLGVAMVPEDRHGQGLVLRQSIADNMALGSLKKFSRALGIISYKSIADTAASWIRRADIRPSNPRAIVGNLSGGNQQKVLLSKWLDTQPRFLIVDEPTRGVDVGAKAEIHRMIVETAAANVGILLISSELEEIMNLAHRIVVFREGRIAGEFRRGEATREEIMAVAFGVTPSQQGLAPQGVRRPQMGHDGGDSQ